MTTTRRFCADDFFRFSATNMDPLTETYTTAFYLSYLARWPGMCSMQEGATGRISSYMIGKAEGRGREWHGHVSALTVAPEFRRLGLAKTLMAELERVSDKACVCWGRACACPLALAARQVLLLSFPFALPLGSRRPRTAPPHAHAPQVQWLLCGPLRAHRQHHCSAHVHSAGVHGVPKSSELLQ
jgi:GNAT superfamily N-acetyltransferase